MSRKTLTYIKTPWDGGINTAVDSGMLNDNDLVTADNVIFATSGSRLKREGLDYFDSAVAVVTARSSSGTTRTLYFKDVDDVLIETTPTNNKKLVVGERIIVETTATSGNELSYAETEAIVLSVNSVTGGHSITYTGTGSLSESETSTTGITITRASSIINLLDYWRLDASSTKAQMLLAATNNFQLFKYNTEGRRDQILGTRESFTVLAGAASTLTTGDYFTFSSANNNTDYYVWFNKDSGGGDPAIAGFTEIEVAVASADTAAQVATAMQLAIDAEAEFTATVDTATVTVTNVNYGAAEDPEDVNTGFTFTVTNQGATAPETTVDKIDSIVFNNRAIFSFAGLGNKPIKYYPEDSADYQILGGNPPDCSLMAEYLGRLWTNDKTDPDLLHYCSTGNHEEWGGNGDSGALPISVGDGDPVGISGIFPFKGILFVQKGFRLLRILGTTPEEFRVEPVSDGIGGESHQAIVPVDQDDVAFLSNRGFHSISTTSAYGDVQGTFLSAKIQPTFNLFNSAKLKNIQGAYVPSINSVAFGVAQNSSTNDTVWLYNTEKKEWYRWPNISCEALSTRLENNVVKLIFGTENGRIIQAQNGSYVDFGTSGILYRVKTGTIYPGGNPQTIKAFKKLTFLYRPKGNFEFTVRVKIDNHEAQPFTFTQESGGDVLGETFVLGQSILGTSSVLAPFTQQLDGYGRGLTLEITQSGTNEQIEIYGFIIEYEEADLSQEVIAAS